MMKQREAVYNAITSVFGDAGVDFEDGMNVETMLTKEYRGSVHSIITEGFKNGTIALDNTPANKAKLADESKLSSYVSGLISNWVRKDPRLNGNTKYVAKNPGSRAGSGDEQLKTLRALAKQFAGTEKEAIINAQIEKRVGEVRAAKVKTVTVSQEQLASLPSDFLNSLGINS